MIVPARLTFLLVLAAAAALSLAACQDTPAPSRAVDEAEGVPPAAAESIARPSVVFLGDSLTAGLGLDRTLSFPSVIAARLDESQMDVEVVNAGVSGDTSAGGLRRLDWALEDDPLVLVLALGANDGLRGLPTTELQKNLAAIIERCQSEDVAVVLAGMEAPPNYGPDYAARFRTVYTDLAASYDVPLIPFLLEGVAGERALNQADGIHPNADGARRVADIVWETLEPVLAEALRDAR